MRLSVERLRWVLLASAVLLVVVVTAFIGYGRYRARQTWKSIVARSGARITRETNGFTYSQSLKGKTVFTLHAARAQQHEDGTWTLRDASLTLYSRNSERSDEIYGSQFEYDPKEQVARAMGEVHMDLEVPRTLVDEAESKKPENIRGKEGRAPGAGRARNEGAEIIHVKTSGLVYMRSLGVAATQQDVEFQYGDVDAHARGAEFDEETSTVHLLADVHLTGEMHDRDVDMTATKADLDRDNDLASFAAPVVTLEGRRISAGSAVMRLRKDGSVESVDATSPVVITAGTATVRGSRLQVSMSQKMQPQRAVLSGGVTLVDTSADRPMTGSAQVVETVFDRNGEARLSTASGGAILQMRERQPHGPMLMRSVQGDLISVATEEDDDGQLRPTQVHAMGNARAMAESMVAATKPNAKPGRKVMRLAADDLVAMLGQAEGKSWIQSLTGTGSARLEQDGPAAGERQTSTADSLQVSFAPAAKTKSDDAFQVANALETGHVRLMMEQPASGNTAASVSTATAATASLDGAAHLLTLTGAAQLQQNGVEVAARAIAMDQSTGNAVADGDVQTTLENGQRGGQASHVSSMRARFTHASQVAEFSGSDAQPARLWHEASEVQAGRLVMNGQEKTLSARPMAAGGTVSAVFVGASRKGKQPEVLRVTSAQMDYSDKSREAVFGGGVTLRPSQGIVKAQQAVVFLKTAAAGTGKGTGLLAANPASGSIDKAVLTGDVRFSEPGRTGVGQQLLYRAESDSFVLTGSPGHRPRVADAQQGVVTGDTLLFGARDSTIVVAGTPGAGKRGRVRTETELGR